MLSALPTGPGEEKVLRDLRRPSPAPLPLPMSFTVPASPTPFRGSRDPGAALTPELLHRDSYGGDPGDSRGRFFKRRHKFHKEDAEGTEHPEHQRRLEER